jgi:hypothetical protein
MYTPAWSDDQLTKLLLHALCAQNALSARLVMQHPTYVDVHASVQSICARLANTLEFFELPISDPSPQELRVLREALRAAETYGTATRQELENFQDILTRTCAMHVVHTLCTPRPYFTFVSKHFVRTLCTLGAHSARLVLLHPAYAASAKCKSFARTLLAQWCALSNYSIFGCLDPKMSCWLS